MGYYIEVPERKNKANQIVQIHEDGDQRRNRGEEAEREANASGELPKYLKIGKPACGGAEHSLEGVAQGRYRVIFGQR